MDGFSLRDSEPFDDWQAAETETYRRDLAGALERVARARATERRWDVAIETTRRWLAVDPLHEPAHLLLIETLAGAGETAAALSQYRDLVRTLDRELGVAPLPETTELADAIRDGRFSPGTPTPSASAQAVSSPVTSRLSMVGRRSELDELVAVVRTLGPDGRLLIVEGEAGVGKTRLAESLAESIRSEGRVVLEAHAIAGEATIPYAVIAELIRAGAADARAAERLGGLPQGWLSDAGRLVALPVTGVVALDDRAGDDPYGRLRVLEALSGMLAALASDPPGGLIWVDDIDRADPSSAEVIGFLARRLAGRPLALLLTGRFEPADIADIVPSLRAAMERPDVRVALDRLGPGDVATLVREALGGGATPEVVDGLVANSEGLPLYVIEALASPDPLGGAGDRGMLALLRGRIASVDEVGRQVLAAAAVIGRSFGLDTVRAAAGRGEEETVDGLEELLALGLIRELRSDGDGDVRYAFSHGRLRDVAYEDTSLARRRLLHGRVAEWLSRTGADLGGPTRWSLVATHATLAGRTEMAAAAHLRAAQLSRAIFANPEAREHYEAALALGHADLGAIHEALGDLLTLDGDYAGALAHYAAAQAQGDDAAAVAIERRIGLVHARRGDLDRADRHLARAQESAVDDRAAGRVLADRAAIAIGRDELPAAETMGAEALLTAQRADDPTDVARAEALLGVVARRAGDRAAARSHLAAALAAADEADRRSPGESPDPGVRIATLNSLALVEAEEGHPDRAEVLIRDALARCERQGDRHRQAALENSLADLLHAQGRADESMEHLKRAVALFAEIGGKPGELAPEIWKLVEW
jgi:tetratricopeptide (TPR) repeat protein